MKKDITTIPALRKSNAAALLKLVWKEREITRADLAKRTTLTPNTISSIVNDLLRKDVLFKAGKKDSTGGRQPDVLTLNPRSRLCLGLSIGVCKTGARITDLYGTVLASASRDVANDEERRNILQRSMAVLDDLLEDFEGRGQIFTLGVSFPGDVEVPSGVILNSSILGDVGEVDLKSSLAERYGLPVLIEHNVNLCALNEAFWGTGSEEEIILFIYAGYGIGAGFTISGDIYRGAGNAAGNLGHTVIVPEGNPCYCGGNGCLETVASYPVLAASAAAKESGDAAAVITTLGQRALAGEVDVRNALEKAAYYIGLSAANLIGIVNPDRVVFGGEYINAREIMFPVIKETVRERGWIASRNTPLTISEFGLDADLSGACSLVLQSLLSEGL